jgi:hypothetical protein
VGRLKAPALPLPPPRPMLMLKPNCIAPRLSGASGGGASSTIAPGGGASSKRAGLEGGNDGGGGGGGVGAMGTLYIPKPSVVDSAGAVDDAACALISLPEFSKSMLEMEE